VVGEDLDIQFHAVLGQGGLHELQQFGVWNGRGGHGQLFGLSGGCAEQGCQSKNGSRCELLEQHGFLQEKIYLRFSRATKRSPNPCTSCTMMTGITTRTIRTSDGRHWYPNPRAKPPSPPPQIPPAMAE